MRATFPSLKHVAINPSFLFLILLPGTGCKGWNASCQEEDNQTLETKKQKAQELGSQSCLPRAAFNPELPTSRFHLQETEMNFSPV